MSGAAFEGLEKALAGREAAEDYEPGVVGFGRDLVERVADYYMSEIEHSAPVALGQETGFFRK